MATQAHPELTSSLSKPNGFFLHFIKACSEFSMPEREKSERAIVV